MAWLQISFHCGKENTERLEAALLELGAMAVTFEDDADQPLLEPGLGETPLWNRVKLTGLFTAELSPPKIITAVQGKLGVSLPHQYEILEDKDWQKEWLKNYHPISFGERLWICPSWTPPPEPDAINLMLDPGMAFGTGTHPTTALCLNWLDGQNLDGKTVIDYGCGSGILAIAALLLGAKHAYAVDYDPQALLATQMNADKNGINPDDLSVLKPDELDQSIDADIILANILSGTLIKLRNTLVSHLKTNALLVMSGILNSQVKEVQSAFSPDILFQPAIAEEDWSRLFGQRILIK